MKYKKVLITGGAGFVGSNICLALKREYAGIRVLALDNLRRRGSELNVARLADAGVDFIQGDVRNQEDLSGIDPDLIIECSAEPSAQAGVTSSPSYVLSTNLIGAINCYEVARKCSSDVIFISTSRVYPYSVLENIKYEEAESRYKIPENIKMVGVSVDGISEKFPLPGQRTFYGASKLSAELILEEYREVYGVNASIIRYGMIAGPWQFGKVDQGIVAHWLAKHSFGGELSYIGYGGQGKQVRDIVHVDDVVALLKYQLEDPDVLTNEIYNAGGGVENSISLLELTDYCQEVTGNTIKIGKDDKTRLGDIPLYYSDNSEITKATGWRPNKSVQNIIEDTYEWLISYKQQLVQLVG